jgi:hypothetical protein
MVHNINSLAVVPYIIAERGAWNVLEERYRAFKPEQCAKIVEAITTKLVKRAERCYCLNDAWRKQLNKAKDQIEFLERFMQHWSYGLIRDYLTECKNKHVTI